MRSVVSVVLAVALAGSLLGCATKQQASTPAQKVTSAESSAAAPPRVETGNVSSLLPFDAKDKGELTGVSVVPSDLAGIAVGSPDDRAQQRYGNRVDVGVFDSIRGVEVRLVIPMWYGKATTYEVLAPSGEGRITSPVPLVDAVGKGDVIWWLGPNASITYHAENGYFVLDSLSARASH